MVLGQVEALQAQFAGTIDAEAGEHMCDVMGFLQPVHHVLLGVGHRRWIDQGVGGDVLADQLIGITATETPFRQGLELLEIDRLSSQLSSSRALERLSASRCCTT